MGRQTQTQTARQSMPLLRMLKGRPNARKMSEPIAAEGSHLYKHAYVYAQFDSVTVSRAKLWHVAKDPVAELKFGSGR